jgi:hypothetical protein
LFVGEHRLVALRSGDFGAGAQAVALQYGREDAAAYAPEPIGRVEQLVPAEALQGARSRELQRWQQLVARGGEAGVGGHHALLGLGDVGAAAQQLGRHAAVDGGQAQRGQLGAARHIAGVFAQQQVQRVFLQCDRAFERGHGGGSGEVV